MDRTSYRIVVGSISVCALVFSVGAVALAMESGSIPEQLVALGVSSFSVLSGLLAPSPKN